MTENLYVVASSGERQSIFAPLVFMATARGIVKNPPTVTVSEDWRDTCGLLEEWASDQGVDKTDMVTPEDVGVWRMSLSFTIFGSEESVDEIAYRQIAQCVEDCIQHAKKAGSVNLRSPSEGVYYFSLISAPEAFQDQTITQAPPPPLPDE